MKRWTLATLSAVVLIAGAPTAPAQVQELDRIVFVDMERVFSEYYKTKRADTRLKEQAETFNEERNDSMQELRDLEAEFNDLRTEANDETLSQEARDRKSNEAEEKLVLLREMQNEIKRFEESGRNQLEKQGHRMRKRIVDVIDGEIEKYAKGRDLFSVIDSSGSSLNQVPVFLYTEAQADITDELLDLLNRGRSDDEDIELLDFDLTIDEDEEALAAEHETVADEPSE